MDTLSYVDLIDQVDQLIVALEADENRFYLVLELAHQLRDELENATLPSDSDDE